MSSALKRTSNQCWVYYSILDLMLELNSIIFIDLGFDTNICVLTGIKLFSQVYSQYYSLL